MKKLAALILVVTIIATMIIPASAAEITASPYYINTNQAMVVLTISDSGLAEITVLCTANSNATKIQTTTYLERKVGSSWVRVSNGQVNNQWTASTTARYLVKDYSCQLSTTGTYRAVAVFTVSGTQSETFTLYSEDIY